MRDVRAALATIDFSEHGFTVLNDKLIPLDRCMGSGHYSPTTSKPDRDPHQIRGGKLLKKRSREQISGGQCTSFCTSYQKFHSEIRRHSADFQTLSSLYSSSSKRSVSKHSQKPQSKVIPKDLGMRFTPLSSEKEAVLKIVQVVKCSCGLHHDSSQSGFQKLQSKSVSLPSFEEFTDRLRQEDNLSSFF